MESWPLPKSLFCDCKVPSLTMRNGKLGFVLELSISSLSVPSLTMRNGKPVWHRIYRLPPFVPSLTMRNGNPVTGIFLIIVNPVPSLTMRNGNIDFFTDLVNDSLSSQPNYEEWKLL